MIDFFNFCNEMLCVADHRGHFVRLNPAWTKTLGWSLEELTGRPYLDFVHPDDRELTIREATLLQNENYETVHFQNRYRCKDGSFKWLEWQAKTKPGTTDLLATARDISDQRRQLEELSRSENRFRSLADHAPIGIAQADAIGNTIYVNQRLCEILGVRAEQLENLKWQELIYEQDRGDFLQFWREHLQSETNMPLREFRIVHGDGQFRWVRCSVAMETSALGKLAGQIVAVEDIHDEKTSEQRLRTIFAQAPVGISMLDSRSGAFLEANPKCAQIMGHSREELLSLDFQSVTHPDDLQDDLDNMALLLKGEIQQFRMEKRYLRPDGSVAWANLTVAPLWQQDECPGRHLAIVEDISERKGAEQKLQTREAQLSALLDHSSNYIFLKDHQGRYLLVNKNLQGLMGKCEAEVYGKTDSELFPAETAAIFTASDAEVWKHCKARDFKEFVRQPDGLHTYRSVKFPVKDEQGNMVALGGIATDITDLTTAYEDLAEKERLLRNLIEVQEQEQRFICYEFHDGLIQYATGSVMILEALERENLPANCREAIGEAIGYLRSGLADGRRVIRGSRPTALDDLGLKAALEDFIDQLSSSGIAIELDFDESIGRLPANLESTVYRVVQESINNARKHSGSEQVKIVVSRNEKHLHVEVRDFGCGFEVESARQQGFGLLGMTERVRLLGGSCEIESQPGAGAKVAIELPLSA